MYICLKAKMMEEITKQKILTVIGDVYEKSAKCKLEETFFSNMNNEVTVSVLANSNWSASM